MAARNTAVFGIYRTKKAAEMAVQGLMAAPISPQSITLLSGEAGKSQIATLATTDAERDGMGEAVGGVVGAVAGCKPRLPRDRRPGIRRVSVSHTRSAHAEADRDPLRSEPVQHARL